MDYTKTMGVVLKSKAVKEGDSIISILTASSGVIKAYVKGAKNYKNRNSAGSAPFSYSEFVLSPGREMYRVNSCLLSDSFYNLSTNIERLAYATYIADLVDFTVRENVGDERLLPFVLNTFYLLANSDKSLRLIKCIFELRLLSLLGLSPELYGCVKCGSEEISGIYAPLGGAVCKTHADGADKISETVLSAMRYITEADDKKVFSFALPPAQTEELEHHINGFMKEYIDRDFYSLTYLNKIIGK
ncbi:MAG: DNA repair protein RecO [Clostridia bacterium]|nr:DNA repair protein RecO [Clostridia bacterium]